MDDISQALRNASVTFCRQRIGLLHTGAVSMSVCIPQQPLGFLLDTETDLDTAHVLLHGG